MKEEIGMLAGAIWQTLDAKGEMPLAKLKKEVKGKTFLFDCAIGWLAREDKIVITEDKKSFRVHLKNGHTQAANAA